MRLGPTLGRFGSPPTRPHAGEPSMRYRLCVIFCHAVTAAAYTAGVIPSRATQRQLTMLMAANEHDAQTANNEHEALMLPGSLMQQPLLPGEYGWIRLIDEHRAFVTREARKAPYNGLLAQQLSPSSLRAGEESTETMVPLYRLCSSRWPDKPGSLVEVLCVGRGIANNVRRKAPLVMATVTPQGDEPDAKVHKINADILMEEMRRLHYMCQQTSIRLDMCQSDEAAAFAGLGFPSVSDDDATSELKAFLRTPFDELISERRNALKKQRSLGANVGSDAELLSYAAASRVLHPDDRLRAVETSSTRERLLMCVEELTDRHGRLSARLAVEQALA